MYRLLVKPISVPKLFFGEDVLLTVFSEIK